MLLIVYQFDILLPFVVIAYLYAFSLSTNYTYILEKQTIYIYIFVDDNISCPELDLEVCPSKREKFFDISCYRKHEVYCCYAFDFKLL